ncbi:MAG: M3 family oligoendopeptidase [Erysipelotrichaceae bacterium]
MNKTWSLNALYKSTTDPKYLNDIQALKDSIEHFNALTNNPNAIEEMLKELEVYTVLIERLACYIQLSQSVATNDSLFSSELNKLSNIASNISYALAKFNKIIASTPNLEQLIESNKYLNQYKYLLTTIKEDAKYLLAPEVESIISKLEVSSGSAWENLQAYLTSNLEINYNNNKLNLSTLRNLAYNPSQDIRKSAYLAELDSYPKICDSVAFALNSIKQQVVTISNERGYASPLDEALNNAHMQRSTLEALISAMKAHFIDFRSYISTKAELLEDKNGLPWYDLFAPIGSTNKSYSIEEAKEYLIKHFTSFDQSIADLIEKAFDNEWIDFYPKAGKVGGAFCSNIPSIKASRILTNFDGSLSDIITLAHELGHAYHGEMIQDHAPLNTEYSMPIAETASTFNELVIMKALIKDANDDDKLVLLESSLQDLNQIICDIYTRYSFETTVMERAHDEFLSAEELNNIMLDAQKEVYGNSMDPNYLHKYMWVNKSHYYSTSTSFYNFPYAFGGLLARGLYVVYEEDPKHFITKYQNLLHATTISSLEDCAKIAGIDISEPTFWNNALDSIATEIKDFIKLAQKK